MRMTFLSILGEPGTFDPGVYDGVPGGADECRWILQSFSYLEGVEIAGVKVAEGEAIPSPRSADAFVLGGSYNSVHDGFAWQESITEWFSELAAAGKPLLGICGGHQLIGRYHGSAVTKVARPPVAGTLPVSFTEAGRRSPLLAGLGHEASFHFANNEHVTVVPEGASCLAAAEGIPVAALDYGNGWYSVQFHPEAEVETLAVSWKNSRPEIGERYQETAAGKRLIENFLGLAEA